MGPTFEMQLARARGIAPSRCEWMMGALLRGLAFGIADDLRSDTISRIAFGLSSGAAMHITYEMKYETNKYLPYRRPRIERKTVAGAVLRGIGIDLAER